MSAMVTIHKNTVYYFEVARRDLKSSYNLKNILIMDE